MDAGLSSWSKSRNFALAQFGTPIRRLLSAAAVVCLPLVVGSVHIAARTTLAVAVACCAAEFGVSLINHLRFVGRPQDSQDQEGPWQEAAPEPTPPPVDPLPHWLDHQVRRGDSRLNCPNRSSIVSLCRYNAKRRHWRRTKLNL